MAGSSSASPAGAGGPRQCRVSRWLGAGLNWFDGDPDDSAAVACHLPDVFILPQQHLEFTSPELTRCSSCSANVSSPSQAAVTRLPACSFALWSCVRQPVVSSEVLG